MRDLTTEIKALAKREGLSLIGIAPAKGWKVASGHRPKDMLSDAKSVVVMAMQMPDKAIDEAPVGERENIGVAVEKEMDRIGAKIMEVLMKKGYIGIPIEYVHFPLGAVPLPYRTPEYFRAFAKHPSHKEQLRGDIPLKYAATKAGLGVIGKSSLLITPQYGPRVRLAAVVTNAPLVADKPLRLDFCGRCAVCERVCVGKAFHEGRHDPEMCWRAEWDLGEPLPGLPFKVCPALCVKLCPVGRLKEKYRPLARAPVKE
jgi:epoxyqueuosine reductase